MPNALMDSLAIFGDLHDEDTLSNLYWEWMYHEPLTLLWADRIFCPKRFIDSTPAFATDVGFAPSTEVLEFSVNYAWDALVREGVIQAIPVSDATREAAAYAEYAVRNRIAQTADGSLIPIGLPVSAQIEPENPADLLSLGDDRHCINHLDVTAAHLVVAQSTNSVWLSSGWNDNVIRWLYCGGFDPEIKQTRKAKAVFERAHLLKLPKCEFIPPVANCGQCGNSGSTCFRDDYGVREWKNGTRHRVDVLLELRRSPEVESLRRLLNTVASKQNPLADDDPSLAKAAEQELKEAGRKAEKRMKKDLPEITKYCDLAALLSIPLALMGEQVGENVLGRLGYFASLGSRAISTSAKLLLGERHRWLKLREVEL